ncbi:MAG: hypothetical protein WDN04_23880 [Rhodospirillales bacterium]
MSTTKLDLAQAEAVADLIGRQYRRGGTLGAALAVRRVLTGEIHALTESLVELRMLAEANIDFPEEGVDFLAEADATGRLAELQAALAAIQTRARGRRDPAPRPAGGARGRAQRREIQFAQPSGRARTRNRHRRCRAPPATPCAKRWTSTASRSTWSITAGLRDTRDEVESLVSPGAGRKSRKPTRYS